MNDFEKFKQQVETAKKEVFGKIDTIIQQIEESGDVEKFYEKGKRSAASRIRKSLQELKKTIHHPTNRTSMQTLANAAKQLREELAKK